MNKRRTLISLTILPFVFLVALSAASHENDTPPPAPTTAHQQAEIVITRAPVAVIPRYVPVLTETPEPRYSDKDIEMLAKTVYGEAGICAEDEQRLVVWTVLQRVDAGGYGDTISDVITAKNQFVGYRPDNPVEPYIYILCEDELEAWERGTEPPTHEIYAPTTPYYFFDGDGRHNWYREEW